MRIASNRNSKRAGAVYLLVLSGRLDKARQLVAQRYPASEQVVIEKQWLRKSGWRGQIKALRNLRGQALVIYVDSLRDLQEPQLTALSAAFHRCHATLIATARGWVAEYSRLGLVRLLPAMLLSAAYDGLTFGLSWLVLWLFRLVVNPAQSGNSTGLDSDLAYLYPYPLDSTLAGGALSHMSGFLSGLALCGAKCEVFSGRELPVTVFPFHHIPRKRARYLFRESMMLSYNLRFAWAVRKSLANRIPAVLYQRHGRFVMAGVLLSYLLRVPLVLEYNASELRMAGYGDPVRFRSWLSLCEQVSLLRAERVVVVSEALLQELVERGIPPERIVLNPNAVDPDVFRPNCGGQQLRRSLGIRPGDVVVGFLGTFSYWHGIEVLGQAVLQLLSPAAQSPELRFLLIGDGPLCAELRGAIGDAGKARVHFTGVVPHEQVPAYLDAADILLSPHIAMPDGKPFFGSPTKLFEYMAMSKAIIASNLDQLAQILSHGRTAWLVEAGNASELASAIVQLSVNPERCKQLGQNARAAVRGQHTWKHNAERVLGTIGRWKAVHGLRSEIAAAT